MGLKPRQSPTYRGNAFEVGARYRTRVAIKAERDRFAAGEVLVYWRYGSSIYHGARGWFFRQAGTGRVRSYDLFHGAPLQRDELFERISGPSAIVTAAMTNDASTIQTLLDSSPSSDPNDVLDREIALGQALLLDHQSAVDILIQKGAFEEDFLIGILATAALHGRALVIATLLSTGIGPDRARPGSQTPLVFAVANKHINAIKVLIAGGADPDLPQVRSSTPRTFAKTPEILALLGPIPPQTTSPSPRACSEHLSSNPEPKNNT